MVSGGLRGEGQARAVMNGLKCGDRVPREERVDRATGRGGGVDEGEAELATARVGEQERGASGR